MTTARGPVASGPVLSGAESAAGGARGSGGPAGEEGAGGGCTGAGGADTGGGSSGLGDPDGLCSPRCSSSPAHPGSAASRPAPARRLPAWTRAGYRGPLAEALSGRANAVGFLRFALAMSVVVSHTGILGFGRPDLLGQRFRNQQALGGLAVAGFFILSGMLITRSARRTGFWRYCWHRALRIFPGLWVCLAVTAFGVAPLIAYHKWGSLNGFWAPGDHGPLRYVRNNMWTGVRPSVVHDLFAATTPWGRLIKVSAFDGALWSLCYELLCYLLIGLLLVSGVLRTMRWLVPLTAALLYVRILMDFRLSSSWGGGVVARYDRIETASFGTIDLRWVVYLGFLFLAAASFELYKEHVPIHDGLGVAALAVCLTTLLLGGWFAIGYPVLVYVVTWAACRLPRRLHWVGRKNDYSYGVYIYGLVGQQVLASYGWNRWGYWPYLALSMTLAWTAAFLSWHLVEKHFLKLKNWSPHRSARLAVVPEPGTETAAAPAV